MKLPLLLALGATFSAAAAPPTAWVAPFKGKTGPSVRAQVAERVCALAACVEKSRATKADFTVQGNVSGDKKKYRVTLDLTPRGKKKPSWRKTWGVTSDGKGLADPDKALSGLLGAMGLEAGAPRAAPAVAALRSPDTTAAPEEKRRERVFTPLDLGGGEAPRASEEAPPAAPPPTPGAPRSTFPATQVTSAAPRAHAPWVEVQVGTEVLTRQFAYADLQIANLRAFRALAIVMPSVQAQVRPLAASGGWPSRLRLEGGFATSVGLRTSISSRTVTYPSSVTRLDGGLRADVLGTPGSAGLGLEAFAGYRSHAFTVGKASDQSVLEGLVGPAYSALRAGVAGRWGFGRVGAFAELAALPLLGTGELQATYFARTAGFGLEGMVGADVGLLPWLGLRLAGQATHYGTTFTTAATDAYLADGASDLYAGATAALRASF
ncbi:MAG: hypothetical protein FJ086_10565 [Deltaproteobacteria bacterium]|nr:hypothetical protein [Deltaproteobacteria bacterium]